MGCCNAPVAEIIKGAYRKMKCLEPKRKCCDLSYNRSKIINLQDAEKENYKPEIELSFVTEECPSASKCKLNDYDYRKGISFITKSKEVFEREQNE